VWSLLIAQSFTSCVLFSKKGWIPGIMLYLTVPYYLYRYICSIKAEFGSGSAWSVPLVGLGMPLLALNHDRLLIRVCAKRFWHFHTPVSRHISCIN
jgi:hypothetical protein